MTPEHKAFRAEDARQLLDNQLLQEAFSALSDYLNAQALGCDPDNKDRAQRIIISKQLLAGIRREIYRHIEDGEIAQMRLAEIEGRKKFALFRR